MGEPAKATKGGQRRTMQEPEEDRAEKKGEEQPLEELVEEAVIAA